MMSFKSKLLAFVFIQISLLSKAQQELGVQSFMLAETDIISKKDQRVGPNNKICSIVKVQMLDDIERVEGNVVGEIVKKGVEKWIYLASGTVQFLIVPKNHLPIHIDCNDYRVPELESKRVYKLRLKRKSSKNVFTSQVTPQSSSSDTYEVNGISFKMIRVEGGTFTMGVTPKQTVFFKDEMPNHLVTLDTYYIGETEVTQELWEAVMGSNPSSFKGPKLPVEMVSWNDCQTFIEKLNSLTKKNFRLPTEAEWEYAARGGKMSKDYLYAGTDVLDSVAWYNTNSADVGINNSDYGTHNVATKQSNELDIYDMSGNVLEWCQDIYGNYSSSSLTNPSGPTSGSFRVIRGGCWNANDISCRVSHRGYNAPDNRYFYLGLRLVL